MIPASNREAAAETPSVVLVTPNETDAQVGVAFLQEAGIGASAYGSLAELCARPLERVGCAVLVEEALTRPEVAEFLGVLAAQPAWSDLPLVLVASQGAALGALVDTVFPAPGNVAVLERPLNPVSLVSAVRVGLRARHRQLEVRDLIEQREAALRSRDEFLAMLAHELRNPLAPLRNAVYIMRQPDLPAGVLQKTHELIDRQTANLKRLVDDLLEVSRLEHGKVQLQLQPLDLNSAIAAAAETCLPLTSARSHTMEVRLAREPLTITADPVRIEQVICNLVANATKFTPEGGNIVVEARAEAGSAEVIVRDSGVGIGADMIGRVFDLFTQDRKTLERAGGGLGIGLTIVKRLVELHGGTVNVQSGGQGKGSQFTVRFPRASLQPAPAAGAERTVSRVASRRVLVIDDNSDIRESLGLILTLWGHEVAYAENGVEGLRLACDMKPDIALIDIGLPQLNGYDVAREIRGSDSAWARAVTLVALTGYGRDADRDTALEAGFDCHLIKPIDPEALASRLHLR